MSQGLIIGILRHVIFPTLFQTQPKIPYPISNQTLILFRLILKLLRTSLNSRRNSEEEN